MPPILSLACFVPKPQGLKPSPASHEMVPLGQPAAGPVAAARLRAVRLCHVCPARRAAGQPAADPAVDPQSVGRARVQSADRPGRRYGGRGDSDPKHRRAADRLGAVGRRAADPGPDLRAAQSAAAGPARAIDLARPATVGPPCTINCSATAAAFTRSGHWSWKPAICSACTAAFASPASPIFCSSIRRSFPWPATKSPRAGRSARSASVIGCSKIPPASPASGRINRAIR